MWNATGMAFGSAFNCDLGCVRAQLFGPRSGVAHTASAHTALKSDDEVATISVDPNRTIARVPTTHAGLIMEGVNHALYGYGLGSQMLFGEGFEEPSITNCTATAAACPGVFPEQWALISGRVEVTSAEVFTGKQALRVDGSAVLLNAGLHRLGIASSRGWRYEASVYYKLDAASPKPPRLSMQLLTNEPQPRIVAASAASVALIPGRDWQRINVTLAAGLTFPNCSLAVHIEGESVVLVDAALLEPVAEHRWHGMHIRDDLAGAIEDAGLRFMRFGGDMAGRPKLLITPIFHDCFSIFSRFSPDFWPCSLDSWRPDGEKWRKMGKDGRECVRRPLRR